MATSNLSRRCILIKIWIYLSIQIFMNNEGKRSQPLEKLSQEEVGALRFNFDGKVCQEAE